MRHVIEGCLGLLILLATVPALAQGPAPQEGQTTATSSSDEPGETTETDEAEESRETETTDEEPTANPAEHPAWQSFHRAFIAIVRGHPRSSIDRLLKVRQTHPDHPSAVFARPILEMYRNRIDVSQESIPTPSDWPPLADHPAVRDKQSAVYDPAWVRYREAFVEVVARRGNRASTKLAALIDKYPDHPAATLADEIESALETRERLHALEQESERERAEQTGGDPTDYSPSEASPSPSYTDDAAPVGARVAAETGGAILGTATGAIIAGGGGFMLAGGSGLGALGVGAIAGSIGAAATFPAGVYFAGNLVNANGDLGFTYLGGLGGLIAGSLMGAVVPGAAVVTVPAFSFAGAIIGYESSHKQFHQRQQRLSGVRILPVVAPNPRTSSGTFGFHISF